MFTFTRPMSSVLYVRIVHALTSLNNGPEKARGLGEFGRREAEKTAENETYENLLDEGSLQKRHGKAEDFA